jgi:structural maintenance of chromosome 1
LKEEYDKAKVEMLKAEEDTQFNYNKKKGIAQERKEAKMEKDEAERYQKLKNDLVSLVLNRSLFNGFLNDFSGIKNKLLKNKILFKIKFLIQTHHCNDTCT